MIRDAIATVVGGRELPEDLAARAMRSVVRGEVTDGQLGGLLAALRTRGETASEIAAFARVMGEVARTIRLPVQGPLVDTCGTGGDGSMSFNISTAAAIVAAGAGVPIAKHGNRAVSSGCGSADVLEALGVRLPLAPGDEARVMTEAGIVFLHAPAHHPAMRHAAGVRREIGVRTVFNILGPLLNPARADVQLLGVYDPALVLPVAGALATLGRERAWVVHGSGLDELTTTGESVVASLDRGRIETFSIAPEELGLSRVPAVALRGGGPAENARIVLGVLQGTEGPARDVVLLNAAAAILLGGRARDLSGGFSAAERAVERGAALERLERLVRATGGMPCFSTT
ncbi:MAG TPA: anthranilate phosphoribosyltransferase [Methanoregulaceae archaeon]|nr:anthranilate phosphoribosyltransferase [Methanoregulaceae archaeon]HQJ87110.1 anthranilate phosphoribosyltransferase [Methanoregulaceae archaeon]